MTAPPSPLATPMPWDLVSGAYVDDVAPLLAHFAADAGELFTSMQRSMAPVAMMKAKLGPAWPAIESGVREDLRAQRGGGPLRADFIANLGLATRSPGGRA